MNIIIYDTIIMFIGQNFPVLSKSESLFNRARNVIPSGVNSPVRFYDPYPFFAVSAKGSKIVTADHEICIDYCMGYGAVLLRSCLANSN